MKRGAIVDGGCCELWERLTGCCLRSRRLMSHVGEIAQCPHLCCTHGGRKYKEEISAGIPNDFSLSHVPHVTSTIACANFRCTTIEVLRWSRGELLRQQTFSCRFQRKNRADAQLIRMTSVNRFVSVKTVASHDSLDRHRQSCALGSEKEVSQRW